MGMDFLDISLRIERDLEVTLSDDDLAELARDGDITVGDLYLCVLRRLNLRDLAQRDIGMNYALWKEIQELLCAVTNTPVTEVELKTPLAALFPRQSRPAAWSALREACRYRVPKLDYPGSVRVIGWMLATTMVAGELLNFWQLIGAAQVWPLFALLGIWMLVETYAKLLSGLARFRTRFPARTQTVKDLCRRIIAGNYEDICEGVEIPLDDECLAVWRKLQEILVDVLGVKEEEITFEGRLVADLRMD